MRLTIDRDEASLLDVIMTILKGRIYAGRLPDEIKRSSGGRGYHYIWHGLNINWDACLELRWKIGDDRNRIAHDLKAGEPEFRQILFTKKKVKMHGKRK